MVTIQRRVTALSLDFKSYYARMHAMHAKGKGITIHYSLQSSMVTGRGATLLRKGINFR